MLVAWIGARALLLLHAAWPFTTDDAYITLRYARHLAAGQGITWNVCESPPVEGYSNFLFVMVGGLVHAIGGDAITVFKILGCCSLGVTCLLLYVLARGWTGPIAATIPALLLTAYRGTIWWTVSGLETSVFQMLTVGAVTAFAVGLGFRPVGLPQKASNPQSWSAWMFGASGFLIFLAGLTRPEGPIIGLGLGTAFLARTAFHYSREKVLSEKRVLLHASLKMASTLLLAFAVPYTIYFIWRWTYFQRLFPPTRSIARPNLKETHSNSLLDSEISFESISCLR